jgi:Tfp pilus assembly protein PilV
MPGTSRRRNLSAPRAARNEAGFALVEVMVSAVLLIVLALATLSVIDRAQATSSNNRSRDVAAQIAQSEQDVIRQMPFSALAGGYHPPVASTPVGGIKYTVTSEAEWVTDSGGAVTCSTSGRVAYLRSTSTVTWAGMGTTKPVVADAIVDPGVAALGANKGALTVLLSKADGSGTPGITVTAGGISSVTDENGCAVIANLNAGTQTLSYSAAGYVDKDGEPAPSRPVTIGAGTIAQATGSYDQAGTIDVDLASDGTPGVVASWPAVSVDHVQRTTPTLFKVFTVDPADTAVDISVFPFSAKYKTYVGDCTGNDPSTYGATAGGAQVNPGQIQPVSLQMRTITVTVNASAGGLKSSVMVAPERSLAPMSTCAATPFSAATFTTTGWVYTGSGNHTFKIAVPYGIWKVCANYQYSSGASANKWAQVKTVTGGTATDDPPVSTPVGTTGTYAYVANPTTTLAMPGASTQTGEPNSCT